MKRGIQILIFLLIELVLCGDEETCKGAVTGKMDEGGRLKCYSQYNKFSDRSYTCCWSELRLGENTSYECQYVKRSEIFTWAKDHLQDKYTYHLFYCTGTYLLSTGMIILALLLF